LRAQASRHRHLGRVAQAHGAAAFGLDLPGLGRCELPSIPVAAVLGSHGAGFAV